MLIFDENNDPCSLNQVTSPIEYFWALDLIERDFTLKPLSMLEEVLGSTVIVEINNYHFAIPSYWNILILDEETSLIDTIEIYKLAGKNYTAFVYGYDMSMPVIQHLKIVDYRLSYTCFNPFLNKNSMLCHPINNKQWIVIGPNSSYNKYIKQMTKGDLI